MSFDSKGTDLGSLQEQIFEGIGLSEGVAFGRALVIAQKSVDFEEVNIEQSEVESEVSRYQKALSRTRHQLESINENGPVGQSVQVSHIMQAHIEILKDPLLTTEVEKAIRSEQKNAEAVMQGIINEWQSHTSFLKDPFFAERSKDIQDLSHRVLGNLGVDISFSLDKLDERSVVVAPEIASMHALEASPDKVSAFVTKIGASTSHAAIIAKAKGIAYVTGIDLDDVGLIERIIVDGKSGRVIINPTLKTLEMYEHREKERLKAKARGLKSRPEHIETRNGVYVKLMANIALAEEARGAIEEGAQGIGLVRSEYLIMGKGKLLGEEEQFALYQKIALASGTLPAIIRTLDISQDDLAELVGEAMPHSPALYRGLRWLLKNKDFFRSHLRAIVRASAYGNIKVMFPMVTDISELLEALAILSAVTKELGMTPLKVGCMIENPAAALMSEVFARYVDFFAIGTNDLTQYSIATDRRFSFNKEVFCPMHPAVVRLIDAIVTAAKRAKIDVLACGDTSSSPAYAPLFIGLGIYTLSMPSRALNKMQRFVAKLDLEEAKAIAKEALKIESGAKMTKFLEEQYRHLKGER